MTWSSRNSCLALKIRSFAKPASLFGGLGILPTPVEQTVGMLQIGPCTECLGTGMGFAQDSNQVSYNGIYGGWKAVGQIAIEVKYPIVS